MFNAQCSYSSGQMQKVDEQWNTSLQDLDKNLIKPNKQFKKCNFIGIAKLNILLLKVYILNKAA